MGVSIKHKTLIQSRGSQHPKVVPPMMMPVLGATDAKAKGVLGLLQQMPRFVRLVGVCVIIAPVWLVIDRDAYDEVAKYVGGFL